MKISQEMQPDIAQETPRQGQTMTEICRLYVHAHFTWEEFKHLANPQNIAPLAKALKMAMLAEANYSQSDFDDMMQTVHRFMLGDMDGPALGHSKEQLKNVLFALVIKSTDWLQVAASFWEENDPAP
jgi:hypothetical protein